MPGPDQRTDIEKISDALRDETRKRFGDKSTTAIPAPLQADPDVEAFLGVQTGRLKPVGMDEKVKLSRDPLHPSKFHVLKKTTVEGWEGRICIPESHHQAFRKEVCDLLKKYSEQFNMSQQELLAITAHLVGQVVAFQDQRVTTPEMALQIVERNIKLGNDEAFASVLRTEGSA